MITTLKLMLCALLPVYIQFRILKKRTCRDSQMGTDFSIESTPMPTKSVSIYKGI